MIDHDLGVGEDPHAVRISIGISIRLRVEKRRAVFISNLLGLVLFYGGALPPSNLALRHQTMFE